MKQKVLATVNNYADLFALQSTQPESYLSLLQYVQNRAVKKMRKKEKISLAFVVSTIATWIGDQTVRFFMDDSRFDVTVVIVWQKNMVKEHEERLAVEHFRNAGIPYIIADDQTTAADYDVLFYCVPYLDMLDSHFDLKDIPLNSLICYTGYGIMQAAIERWQFNLPIHNCCWMHYSHVAMYADMAKEFCGIGAANMVCSGYPKMDSLVDGRADADTEWSKLWKVSSCGASPLKIVYAPHHSINDTPYFSTFQHNFKFFYEYAKAHADTTSWVVKPHPLLRITSVKEGVFQSEDEFEHYLKMWEDLPNARVLDGEYIGIFPTSDCMILDSVSFCAEYLYVHKPILFLTRPGEQFNALGAKISTALYRVDGRDFSGIQEFIEKTARQDPNKPQREDLFHEELDYFSDNHMTAAEYIYHSIAEKFHRSGAVDLLTRVFRRSHE